MREHVKSMVLRVSADQRFVKDTTVCIRLLKPGISSESEIGTDDAESHGDDEYYDIHLYEVEEITDEFNRTYNTVGSQQQQMNRMFQKYQEEGVSMFRWFKQFFCRHSAIRFLCFTVSRHDESEIWECVKCGKTFHK
jgi:hypothetical protein